MEEPPGAHTGRDVMRLQREALEMNEKDSHRNYNYDGNCLEEKVVGLLAEKHLTVTTAESCTGGLIAGTLVNVAGASDVLNEGYVTYSNEAKERLVGVRHETLERYGAVSEQTAREMAEGAAKAAGADAALSSTGIAGPGGGTAEKPVGLVYIGCYLNGRTTVEECHFAGNRMENRMHTVERALAMLQEALEQETI